MNERERLVNAMKKLLAILVISLMIFIISGCSKNDEIQNRKSHSLSSEEIVNLDLVESGITRQRSIDDICVHEEPLVYKENVYNESGVLVQYIQYEYDEKNRYKTIYNYQKKVDTPEMELFLQEDYSYDEYFYYKRTTYVQRGGLVTQDIYDTHNNIVMTQIPDKQFENVSTLTYTYKYPMDTVRTEEEYAYVGEGVNFSHYTIRRFNEYGDEMYSMTRYNDGVFTMNKKYEYDQAGRMISMQRIYSDEDIFGEDRSYLETIYTYDAMGNLMSEEDSYISEAYADNYSVETRQFIYDDMGRLIRKTTCHKTKNYYSEIDESVYSVEYIYEPENGELENIDSEVIEEGET